MNTIPFGHHELHNRYSFMGTLKLVTPLRLSSGQASDETDAPLMQNRNGTPYIPGSSLRGAIRSEVERILAALGNDIGLETCTLFTKGEGDNACISVNRTLQLELVDSDDEKALDLAQQKLCDVCKLFGSTVYASRLIIEDSYPQAEGQLEDKLENNRVVRDGVGIDRDTGTAVDGAKFDYEVLETGPTFTFRMQAENVTDNDKKLLNLILGLLKQGLHVGGKRAAGLGKIQLENEFKVEGFENPKALWQAIMQGNSPHQLIQWKEEALC